jgi:LmbE family N-acetylglucosaminyl deacetylase
MICVTILSPHRDDAIFSAGIAMARWAQNCVRVHVLNFFTRSKYSPWRGAAIDGDLLDVVSSIRAREDRKALRAVDPGIRSRSLALLDAPVRLDIPVSEVCSQCCGNDLVSECQQELTSAIRESPYGSFFVGPLALGDHIDHLTVRSAAIASVPPRHLGFYEDLPYAAWTSEHALTVRVRETEDRLGARLRPVTVRENGWMLKKRRLVAHYASQITPAEAKDIAKFAGRYRGGERLWLPANSAMAQSLAI